MARKIVYSEQWREDCEHWRGRVLTGLRAHWCEDYDGLPVDETCPEWPCACYERTLGPEPRE